VAHPATDSRRTHSAILAAMSRRARDDAERPLLGLPPCATGEVTIDPEPRPDGEEPQPDLGDPASAIGGLPTRFEVRSVVGRGGMGIVVAAYDRSLERDVAIKMIRLDRGDPRIRERFLREARAAAPLRDRGIVQVYDIDPDGKYIVMELVHGESLSARLEREPLLPAVEVRRIGRALAGALAVAHAAGIVHRDVKPSNVLLDRTGDVKLADFGVALFADSELTAPGVQVGTPAYMAPEQLRGKETDARADVYAAGATLFRIATGDGLHDRGRSRDVAAHVLEATGDRGLAEVIDRAVREDPGERFADGGELLAALTAERMPSHRRARSSRSRYLVLATVAAIGAGAWYVSHRETTRVNQPPPVATDRIAVEPIRSAKWRDIAQAPDPTATGDVLAILLGEIDGFRATGATELASVVERVGDLRWEDAARSLEARYLVRGAIEQRGRTFHASFEVRSLPDATTTRLELDAVAIPGLMNDLAERIARSIDPRKTLRRGPDPQRARLLFARGEPKLERLDFKEARPFLDQSVDADPSYFDAWYALASVRAWMMAPEGEVREAIDAASRRADPGPKKQLLEGSSRFMHRDYPGSRAVLEPLVATRGLSRFEQRDVLYYLGEANWHDGRHATAAQYFRRAVELDGRFKPAAIHLGEYAVARRDLALAIYVGGLLEHPNQDPYDFMRGRYEALASTSTTEFRLFARLVLGQTPTPDDEALIEDRSIYRVASALGSGQAGAARRSIDTLWSAILERSRGAVIADSTYLQVKTLADVLLCASEIDDLRRVVAFMGERSKLRPVFGYQRMSILAAPLVGERAWIVRDGLTERETQLADAIEAEMTGDRRRAAELLGTLVADPTASWDYPERVALLRNLRALGRDKEARTLCNDTLHPAIFTWAYLPARRQCQGR